MKTCNSCLQAKNLEEFNWRNKAAGIRQGFCRACKKKHQHDWYIRHRLEQRVRVVRDKKRNQAKVYANLMMFFSTHPCVDCGETDPIVLEFDHVRGVKVKDVCTMVAQNLSWKKIVAEIQKCEIRCSNCHKSRTAKKGGFWKFKFGLLAQNKEQSVLTR